MLRIRLTRGGSKKRPYYAIVVADSHSPRDGRFIERVGTYNPLLKKDDPNRVNLKIEQLQAWLAKGAQPSDRVARFLAAEGLVQWTHGDNPNKGKPHAKAVERVTERADRAAALAAAPPPPPPEPEPTPAEEAAPAEEPAVTETPAEEPAPVEAPAVTETPAEEPAPVEAPSEPAPEETPAEPAPEEAPAAEAAAEEAPAEEAAAEETPAADDGATEA